MFKSSQIQSMHLKKNKNKKNKKKQKNILPIFDVVTWQQRIIV